MAQDEAGQDEGFLTTHVLDTANGRPAAGVRITLYRLDEDARAHVAETVTNQDGRTDAPLIAKGQLRAARYELVFEIGAYFTAQGLADAGPAFLDRVPVVFGIGDADEHYHVPLLVSPYGYSTYRGS